MDQLCIPCHIQIGSPPIARQDQVAGNKTDNRQLAPPLIKGETEHTRIQNRHINEQHQVTPHAVADKER